MRRRRAAYGARVSFPLRPYQSGAYEAVREAATQPRQKRETSPTVRKLFVLLHGAYGSTFLSKYSTGEAIELAILESLKQFEN